MVSVIDGLRVWREHKVVRGSKSLDRAHFYNNLITPYSVIVQSFICNSQTLTLKYL